MEIFPEYDLILLGGNIIYVPSEDFLMVQEFLSSRLHKKAKIRMHGVKKEEYISQEKGR